ncbi:carbamoylphosphate synthase large subunit [Streptococcus pneumoniae]|nr:carbamoylphosphate synthase large subunit [Streptococcus pneumoniae]
MNYLVISPYYPQNFQQFTIELANKGITVLGIGQESYEQLDEPLRNSLTEYFRVDNLENIDEVKRAVAFLFYKHGPIDRIESHNEYWLELDATLREQFNVFGAKPEDLKKTKYKSEMKKLFKKAGVPVVPGAVIKTEADVDQAVKEIGLPMIAKPDNGGGQPQPLNLRQKTISITSSKNGTIQPFISLKNLSLPAKSVPLTGSWTRMERLSSQQPLTTPIHRLTS